LKDGEICDPAKPYFHEIRSNSKQLSPIFSEFGDPSGHRISIRLHRVCTIATLLRDRSQLIEKMVPAPGVELGTC
jgi:hypothetical protein